VTQQREDEVPRVYGFETFDAVYQFDEASVLGECAKVLLHLPRTLVDAPAVNRSCVYAMHRYGFWLDEKVGVVKSSLLYLH
jgi:hypothetical protein